MGIKDEKSNPQIKLPNKAILADLEDIEKARILKEYVETERNIAIQLGLLHTFVRPFLFPEEQLGAMRCCCRKCKETSVYVAYIIGLHGRVAYCQKHGFEMMIVQMDKVNNSKNV